MPFCTKAAFAGAAAGFGASAAAALAEVEPEGGAESGLEQASGAARRNVRSAIFFMSPRTGEGDRVCVFCSSKSTEGSFPRRFSLLLRLDGRGSLRGRNG